MNALAFVAPTVMLDGESQENYPALN